MSLMKVVVKRLLPIIRTLSSASVVYSISEGNFTCVIDTVPGTVSSITVCNEADTEAFTLVKRSGEPITIYYIHQSESFGLKR